MNFENYFIFQNVYNYDTVNCGDDCNFNID